MCVVTRYSSQVVFLTCALDACVKWSVACCSSSACLTGSSSGCTFCTLYLYTCVCVWVGHRERESMCMCECMRVSNFLSVWCNISATAWIDACMFQHIHKFRYNVCKWVPIVPIHWYHVPQGTAANCCVTIRHRGISFWGGRYGGGWLFLGETHVYLFSFLFFFFFWLGLLIKKHLCVSMS